MWASLTKGFVDTKMIGYVEVDEKLGDMLCIEGPASRVFLLGKTVVPAYQVEAVMLSLRGVDEVMCMPGKKNGSIHALVVTNPDADEDVSTPMAMLDALLEKDPKQHLFKVWEAGNKNDLDVMTLKAFYNAVQSGQIVIEIVESLPQDWLSM